MHRLLPVRLRQLGREQPDSRRSFELGAVRRAAGSQQRDAQNHSGERRRRRRSPVAEDRRLLRVVHGREGDRRERDRAARSAAEENRRGDDGQRARADRRGAPHDWRRRLFRLRIGSGLQRRLARDGDCRPGRHGSPRARLLLQRRCEVEGAAGAVRRARREDAVAPRRAAGAGRRVGAGNHAPRDGARQRRARRRLAARPDEDLSQADARRAADADAAVPVAAVLQGHRGAADLRAQRHRARFLQGARTDARFDVGRRSEGVPAVARRALVGARAGEAVRRRKLQVLRHRADRREGAAAAVEALRPVHGRRSRRSARAGFREGKVRSRGESRHAEDGARDRSGARERPEYAHVDDRCDQA